VIVATTLITVDAKDHQLPKTTFHISAKTCDAMQARRMNTLMRMQASYDIARTRKREKQIHVRRIHQLPDLHA